eukprot:7169341-Pyramimonas_sp.AAC.1
MRFLFVGVWSKPGYPSTVPGYPSTEPGYPSTKSGLVPALSQGTLALIRTVGQWQRGKAPVVVGGTGLYLRWFVHGKPGTPKKAPDTRERAAAAVAAAVASGGEAPGGGRAAGIRHPMRPKT